MHEGTLTLKMSKLGPDHPSTLSSRINLAEAYESLNRWTEAERLRSEVLSRRRKSTPPDSPLLAYDLDRLAFNLLKQSKWSQAESLLHEAMGIRNKKLSDDWSLFLTMSRRGGAVRASKNTPRQSL